MSANCRSCGKMMTKPEDFSRGDINSQYCSNCTNADGSLKSLDEITLHIANQLIMSQGIDREAATKAARSILSVQPEWKMTFRKRESRKALKNKILIVATCVVLVVTTIVVYNIFAPNPNRTYRWNTIDVTTKLDDWTEIAKIETFSKPDGIVVNRVKMDGYQSVDDFDSSGLMDLYSDTGERMIYKCFPKGNLLMGSIVGVEGKGIDFIGSINNNANQSNSTPSTDVSRFWLDNTLKNRTLQIESSKAYGDIGYVDWNQNVVFTDKFAVWLEKNSNPQLSSIVGYNVETGKVFEIDGSKTVKLGIKAGYDCVYWLDSNNPKESGYLVKGFDLKSFKPVDTGITVANKSYKYSKPFNGIKPIEAQPYDETLSMWQVVGDDIVFIDIGNEDRLTLFDRKTGRRVPIINASYSPYFWPVFLNNADYRTSTDKGYAISYRPTNMLLFDKGSKLENRYIAWLKMNTGQSFSIQYSKFSDLEKVNTINSPEGVDLMPSPFLITGKWLVWSKPISDDESNRISRINARNLETGQSLDLGSYEVNQLSVKGYDGYLVWSALTKDSDYDIFYTRLP